MSRTRGITEKNMKTRFLIATTILVCAAVPAAAQTGPVCLRQIDIYSFDAVPGNRSLIVEDRRHQRYRLNFQGICTGLQYKMGLAFKSFSNSNLSCLSRGDQVIQREPIGPSHCIIRDIQRQTPQMDRADRMEKDRRR